MSDRSIVRVGVLGAGFGAAVHVPGLQALQGVRVQAIAVANLARAQEVSVRLDVPRAYGGWENLPSMESNLDAVTVAPPPFEADPAITAALERGLHVLAEKPLASSAEIARDHATRARGLAAMVDYEFVALPSFQIFKGLLLDRRYGRVRHASLTWHVSSPSAFGPASGWKSRTAACGGVMTALGEHALYLMEWLVGRIYSIAGATSCRVWPDDPARAPDTAHIERTTETGCALAADISNASGNGWVHHWKLECEHATFHLVNRRRDYLSGFVLSVGTDLNSSTILHADDVMSGDGRVAAFTHLAEKFIGAVRHGIPVEPSFDDGARVRSLVEAMRGTAQDLAPVQIPHECRQGD